MKKTIFLIAIALMIGTFGYSQILGGPAYQTEKPDRTRPIADIDIEQIINFIYKPVNDIQPVDELHFTGVEFNDVMKPVNPAEINITPEKPAIYRCDASSLQIGRNGEISPLKYVRCTRIN